MAKIPLSRRRKRTKEDDRKFHAFFRKAMLGLATLAAISSFLEQETYYFDPSLMHNNGNNHTEFSQDLYRTNDGDHNTNNNHENEELPLKHRIAPIDLRKPLSYTHITKNGGTSWIRELKKLKATDEGGRLPLYPWMDFGQEHSLQYQDEYLQKEYFKTKDYSTMITLRSPNEQVWSMYRHCFFGSWGSHKLKRYKYYQLKNKNDTKSVLKGFQDWLELFLDQPGQQRKEYSATGPRPVVNTTTIRVEPPLLNKRDRGYLCYHPANFQSRFLMAPPNHFPVRIQEDGIVAYPLKETLQTADTYDFVGLLEFFHESKCLLYYRVQLGKPQEGQLFPNRKMHQNVTRYLEDTCHCRSSTTNATGDIKHMWDHGGSARKASLEDASPAAFGHLEFLTRHDRALYVHALVGFMAELVWMESDLGHRVLCEDVLQTQSKALQYLGELPVTARAYPDSLTSSTNKVVPNLVVLYQHLQHLQQQQQQAAPHNTN